jgi:diaminohydroxyphosphoribosylaminopyrimidine deaminase / 5-amino-6-(5-phosphoribosylamino)uracil reductase
MAAAVAMSERGLGRTGVNPSVGCIIVKEGRVVGRGWTHPSGRPHAEAVALEQAGTAAAGATVYVTLEPCAHHSERGPACAQILADAHPARVVIACIDTDPRTAEQGIAFLRAAGIAVDVGIEACAATHIMAGYICRQTKGRPFVTLKLATSLDGAIAMADGTSRWITGEAARAHAHLERARADVILVGAGTWRADAPMLNVRLPGLEDRSPRRVMLSSGDAPSDWDIIRSPQDIASLGCNNLMIEGGAQTAASFLKAGLVNRLLLYRAPIIIGGGVACMGDIGLTQLPDAHGQWRLQDCRMLGKDRLEIYRNSLA